MEHKEAERDISEEKERLAVTLRSIAEGVIATSLDVLILMMNQVAEKLTGDPYKRQEALILTVSLTLLQIYLPASFQEKVEIPRMMNQSHHGKGTFIVMDAEVFMLEIVSDMLMHMGYQVIQAASGTEALVKTQAALEQNKHIVGEQFLT